MIRKTDEIAARAAADPAKLIAAADDAFDRQLLTIAEDIRDNRVQRPIILLSGPSGSGKTTTALSLEKILDDWGCETHTISMDNYFFPLTEAEQLLCAKGELDLESPKRVDAHFLTAQLDAMARCESVELPKYDFKAAKRTDSGKILARKPDELVICEGIHALNPEVIALPDDDTARIYVSVRARLASDALVLHPSKIRLMRRMIRDRNFRNRSLAETLGMFESVERGEAAYIMPYKDRSTYDVDTFFSYEPSVYRPILEEELRSLQDPLVDDLLQILPLLPPIPQEMVPKTSLIREFLGHGQFHY